MNITTETPSTTGGVELTSDGLTPEEKHKQVVFAVAVAIGVVVFLLLTIGHAAIGHIRNRRT